MPYIRQQERIALDDGDAPQTPGGLAYVIYRLCLELLVEKGVRYEHMATIIGVLDSVKHEFMRRQLDPYENQKRYENGDV